MNDPAVKLCFITATVLTGLLCGASLDQSFKQLPARHRIGVKAFSEYAKAADLKNGVVWYAILGVGATLASIATAVLMWVHHVNEGYSLPLYLGGLFAICHSVCTSIAAPIYHKQKMIQNESELEILFNKFELVQTIRSIFCVLNFLAFVWVLIILV